MGARETIMDIIDRAYLDRWGAAIRDRVWLGDLAEDIERAVVPKPTTGSGANDGNPAHHPGPGRHDAP